MKITKIKIEEMANEIIDYLKRNNLETDVCIYFNNKRICFENDWDRRVECLVPYEKVEENINPLDYFEYANEKHILSMSFEGDLYEKINYGNTDKLDKIFEKYGLYYELGHAWNLSVFPIDDNYDEIEYTSYEREPEPEFIYLNKKDVLPELKNIMIAWHELSTMTGDKGSCVIGAGYKFKYKGKSYEMSACSPWQGSISWEEHIGTIRGMLINIGATDIHYNYGRMD